ncbi:MAG: hypothetical protein BM563_09070 [Bacteroidetes bacterium MedPE-SWsnd-G1]|nr:MAG: hypothetical protein BM563_09070 [Bacteroidetes bacterium MedPE-SWsnd-G1]
MNRRNALKNLGLFTGGVLLFPSCDFSDEKVGIILNKLKINAKQESLLTSIVDTIIPEDNTPGGISAKCHNFVWACIDDCTSPEDQKKFIEGLNEFNTKTNDSFDQKNMEERTKIVDSSFSDENKNIQNFLNSVKGLSVWCYTKSEHFLTVEMPYKLVPGAGTYNTCKTIDPNQKINSNA